MTTPRPGYYLAVQVPVEAWPDMWRFYIGGPPRAITSAELQLSPFAALVEVKYRNLKPDGTPHRRLTTGVIDLGRNLSDPDTWRALGRLFPERPKLRRHIGAWWPEPPPVPVAPAGKDTGR